MVKKFSDNSSGPERALQIWQILIAKAYSRQTITYIDLAKMMDYPDARPLPNILGYVMTFCDKNNLPPLTILVVNKGTGAPGDGLTTVKNLDTDRENVFKFDWYALVPPTPEQFRQAGIRP